MARVAKTTGKKTATKKSAGKKKTTAKKTGRKKRPAALSDVGTHKLRKDQLVKWRMLEAEVKSAKMHVQMMGMILQNVLTSTPAVVKANTNVEVAKRSFNEKYSEYNQYMSQLSESIGLDLSKCSIDDMSGLVREIPRNESEGEN